MPPEFHKELKLYKLNAVLSILGSIVFIIMLGLYLMAWNPVILGICVVLGIVFVFSHYLNYKIEKQQDPHPWIVKTGCRSAEELAALFAGECITDGCHIAFGSNGKHRIRLLTIQMEQFATKEAARMRQNVNRKVNTKYGIKSQGSIYEISRMVRVNLVVVHSVNDELISWVKRTERTLSRVEIILNLALVAETGELLVPKLKRGHTLSEVSRYEAGITSVLERLCI